MHRSLLSRCLVILTLAAMLLVTLSGCGRAAKGLVILDWSGYEQEVFWSEFKAEHPDVKVEWTFFADDSEAFAKLQTGFVADAVHPSTSWLQIMVDNDMLQPIDTTKLDNWPGIMEPLAKMGQVDGVQYLVPWEWGYDSILVRTDKVAEVPDSWADLWDPQYAGHVSILDSAEAAVVAASIALGYDPYTLTDAATPGGQAEADRAQAEPAWLLERLYRDQPADRLWRSVGGRQLLARCLRGRRC